MKWFGDVLTRGPLREGFLGIGGSGSKTDRSNELSGLQSQWNIFGQGLNLQNQTNATGQQQQQQGQANLNSASQYWKNLLTAGRTQTATDAAPAVDAAVAGENAQRTQGAQFGSGRSGGTAAGNQQAQTNTQSNIDQIINQNLVGGKTAAATGLTGIGSTELSAGSSSIAQALSALGISGGAGQNIATDASGQRQTDIQQEQQLGSTIGEALAGLFL